MLVRLISVPHYVETSNFSANLCEHKTVGCGGVSWDRDVIVAGFLFECDAPTEVKVAIRLVKRQEMELHARFLNRAPKCLASAILS